MPSFLPGRQKAYTRFSLKKDGLRPPFFSVFPYIPFLLLPEHSVTDKILDKDCRQGEKKPYTQKQQADLTHYIEGQIAVIPDLHAEADVYNNAADKFGRGYYNCPDYHLHGNGNILFEKAVQSSHPYKTKAACNEHGRMGVTPV